MCVGFLACLFFSKWSYLLFLLSDEKKEKQTSFVGFCADEADHSWGLWNMETDIRCFCTGPVDVLTEVILACIIAYLVLVLQILYINSVLRRLTPHFSFFKKRRV